MVKEKNNRLVWIDLEMSGLNPDVHVILEVAAVVTESNLEIVSEGPDIAVYQGADVLRAMEPWSREHHQASGLLDRVQASSYDIEKAERKMLDFLDGHVKKGKTPLCGNSIWQDRRFLRRYMPTLEAFFHYRNIDVSSVKELVKRWYPDLRPFEKQKKHLALDDIKESILELGYYRQYAFVPLSGL